MVNAFYSLGLQQFLEADVDYLVDNIALVCIDEADDVPVLATDDFLDDILVAARVATSGNLASKTSTNGVADAADITLTSVTGDQFESFTIYQNTGVESTSSLICNFDTATGLPLTPNGGDVDITWNASGIFALGV